MPCKTHRKFIRLQLFIYDCFLQIRFETDSWTLRTHMQIIAYTLSKEHFKQKFQQWVRMQIANVMCSQGSNVVPEGSATNTGLSPSSGTTSGLESLDSSDVCTSEDKYM